MEQSIIDKINIVAFEVRSISGTVSRESDKSDDVFTSGSVRYINPDVLKAFASARQQGNRICRNHGVKFLSGWAIPDAALDKVVGELNPLVEKVEEAKNNLLANWFQHLYEWGELHKEALPYRTRFPSVEYVRGQTGSRISVFRIQPQSVSSKAEDGVEAEVKGLAGRVLHEIAQDVQDTWNPSATQASQRIKNLLGRIAGKCRTLEFLGGNLGSMASFIEDAIKRLPPVGAIQGPDYIYLAGILTVLSSPQKMEKISKSIDGIQNMSQQDLCESFVNEEIKEPEETVGGEQEDLSAEIEETTEETGNTAVAAWSSW
jgi:hypothetical protein